CAALHTSTATVMLNRVDFGVCTPEQQGATWQPTLATWNLYQRQSLSGSIREARRWRWSSRTRTQRSAGGTGWCEGQQAIGGWRRGRARRCSVSPPPRARGSFFTLAESPPL